MLLHANRATGARLDSVESMVSDCTMHVQVGWSGYLNTHEKYFYCLDALPIFVAFCIYSLLPFGKYLDAPLALRLPTTAKEIIVNDSSSSMQAPVGTNASSKAMRGFGGREDVDVSTVV